MIPPAGEIPRSSVPIVSHFSDRVARKGLRTITLGHRGPPALEISFYLERPLSAADLERIRLEAQRNAEEPVAGVLTVLAVEAEPETVRIIVPPLPKDVVRLDALQRALRLRRSPLGHVGSRYVIERVACISQALRCTSDLYGRPRVHGALHKGAILIAEGGAIAVVGTGLAAIDSLLVQPPSDPIGKLRSTSPEALRNEPLDERADIYALGVLYYELLSGHEYRPRFSSDQLMFAALEALPPDLPGELPNPQPELVELLRAMLWPSKEQRISSLERVIEAIANDGTPDDATMRAPELLDALVREFMLPEMEQGPSVLIGEGDDLRRDGRIIGAYPGLRDVVPAFLATASEAPTPAPVSAEPPPVEPPPVEPPPVEPPPVEPPPVEPPPARNDWSKVLGEDVEEPAPAPKLGDPAPIPASLDLSNTVAAPKPSPIAALAEPPTPRKPSASKPVRQEGLSTGVKIAIVVGVLSVGVTVPLALKLRATLSEDAARVQEISNERREARPIEPPVDRAPAPVKQAAVPAPAAAKGLALITIISQPSGATVELNGGYVGKTPLIMRTKLDKQTYSVTITADGHHPWTREVYVDREKNTLNVSAILEPE
jgi:serine/threonine protein kinase